MSLIFTIYDTTIPDSDIKAYPVTDERITFANNEVLTASTLQIVLDNTESSNYDDRISGSLFFGSAWYGENVKVYDTEVGDYIWEGTIKTLTINNKDKTVTVESTNYVYDIAQSPLIYVNASNKTAAEIIYEIITDVVGVDTDDIIYSGFTEGITIQIANSVYFNLNYAEKDNVNCLAAISELCRITQSYIYTVNNKIYYKQWQAYDGTLGSLIEEYNIIENDYSHIFDGSVIYNSYSIKYAGVSISTGTNTTSIAKYGKRSFVVPDQKNDSTTDSDYKILLRNSTGAEYCGDLAISRYQEMKKKIKMSLGYERRELQLDDQIDLSFDTMVREPAVITARQLNRETRVLEIEGEYLNTPYAYAVRDQDAPSAPEMIEAIPLSDGGVLLKWTISTETDAAGYLMYYTSTPGEWDEDFSNLGQSPSDIKNPSTTIDGYAYIILYQLNSGTEYSFKIKSYDTSLNKSDFSNIKKCISYLSDIENKYYCTGENYSGLTLDATNSELGTVPLDWYTITNIYGTGIYGTATYWYIACYESGEIYQSTAFTYIKYISVGTIYFQYRIKTLSVWGSWSDSELLTAGVGSVEISGEIIQYRFLFAADVYTATDSITVTEVI